MSGRTQAVAEAIATELTNSEVELERFVYDKKVREILKSQEKIAGGDLSDFKFDENVMDLGSYDMVLIGSPTYGSRPAPVFNGFLENAKNIEAKSVIVFNTCRFIGGRCLEMMATEVEKKGGKVKNRRMFKSLFKIKLSKAKEFGQEINQQIVQ